MFVYWVLSVLLLPRALFVIISLQNFDNEATYNMGNVFRVRFVHLDVLGIVMNLR